MEANVLPLMKLSSVANARTRRDYSTDSISLSVGGADN
jgi:hypothetical protein